ncbi:MAG: Hpt domain-containing protein [Bacteroidota bacterium]
MYQEKLKLDFEQLRALTGDDPEFMLEILEIIEDQSPEVLSTMKTQLELGEYKNLSATAHKYKSSINILGNLELNRLVKDIELKSKTSDGISDLNGLMSEFEQICGKLLYTIKGEIEALKEDE